MAHDIIVKQHRIDVETEPGEFTEFIITPPRDNSTLPIARVRNDCLSPQAAVEGCLLFRRCRGISRFLAHAPKMMRETWIVLSGRVVREDSPTLG